MTAAWATVVAGLVGLIVGNFLNRSMEYRKWRRIERHKACSQLLDASQATMLVAAWHVGAPQGLSSNIAQVNHDLSATIDRLGRSRLLRIITKPASKRLARQMNPEAAPGEIDETLTGVLSSIASRSGVVAHDLLSDRLGVGKDGTIAQLRDGANRLGAAIEAVELICPSDVVIAGWKLYWITLRLAERNDENEANRENFVAYSGMRTNFIEAARRDLVRLQFNRKKKLKALSAARTAPHEESPMPAMSAVNHS